MFYYSKYILVAAINIAVELQILLLYFDNFDLNLVRTRIKGFSLRLWLGLIIHLALHFYYVVVIQSKWRHHQP